MANDKIDDNLNLVCRIYYTASTVIYVPNSLVDKGIALGAQAGEDKMRELVLKAGFSRFTRAVQTPFNIIYEAKIR